ncbi:hypothetical protein GH714_010624 [Hevea brasiliensis]|uniref:Uncharacterized protein n=1 Tax=Hevea brasiliensis TaxID=3981 RepID=A0A6A6M9D1_HEVBR|nr:hypothetical protein GH714_010624 [Hevea brasiliensis]
MPSPRTFARKIGSLLVKMLGTSKSSSSYELLSRTDNGNKTPPQARRGYIAMYVGEEAKRYEVPVENLRFPPLQELIKQSRDYDLESKIDGPIVLACCTTNMFDQLLKNFKIAVNSKFSTLLPICTINKGLRSNKFLRKDIELFE